ncbi:MAG: asparagine synthase-related protein [Legionellaceae bacterium]|nr:asparagine synthase-related protein [Legionellaceae bacterium]
MFAGVFYRDNQYCQKNFKQVILDSISQFNITELKGVWQNSHISMACCLYEKSDAINRRNIPQIHTETKCVIIAWARLDRREYLTAKLGIKEFSLLSLSDHELIIEAYLKWGENCTQHLAGAFSFVIFDPRNQSMFCSRDHMGIKPFYYYLDENVFLFSSSISVFHQLKLVSAVPDESWMANYLMDNSMSFENTAYTNILKLKPAHQLIVKKKSSNVSQYFSFDCYHINKMRTIDDYIQAYKEKLIHAVQSRLVANSPVACELSGGIDSSSITAIIANCISNLSGNLYTFSHAYLEKEPEYILSLCQYYGLENNFISCGLYQQSNKNVQKYILNTLGAPLEHYSAQAHIKNYIKQNKLSIHTLFSGFGGDEFVTSIHSKISQLQLLKEKKYINLYKNVSGNCFTKLLRCIKMPYDYFLHMKPASSIAQQTLKKRWDHSILNKETINKFDLEAHFFSNARFNHKYTHLNEFTVEACWAPYVATRTENCTLLAKSFGIDYTWPLLDLELITFFMSIPVEYKQINGICRYIHRKAVSDIMPKKIIWKTNKNMGAPIKQFECTKEALDCPTSIHPQLEAIINPQKLQQLVSEYTIAQTKNLRRNARIVATLNRLNRLNSWLYEFH